jgi:hypothetical protein
MPTYVKFVPPVSCAAVLCGDTRDGSWMAASTSFIIGYHFFCRGKYRGIKQTKRHDICTNVVAVVTRAWGPQTHREEYMRGNGPGDPTTGRPVSSTRSAVTGSRAPCRRPCCSRQELVSSACVSMDAWFT